MWDVGTVRAYFGSKSIEDAKALHDSLWSDRVPEMVALDIETPSTKDTRVISVGIAVSEHDAFYYSIGDPDLPWPMIWPGKPHKVWHNAPFDLAREALGGFGADIENIGDTAILTRMMPNVGNALSDASQYVRTQTQNMGDVLKAHDIDTKKASGKLGTLLLPPEVLAQKCANDVLATFQIYNEFKPQVSSDYYEQERRFLVKLLAMSHKGIKLDQERVRAIDKELATDVDTFMGSAKVRGFNPRSPKEVGAAMNKRGHWLPPNQDSMQPKTGAEYLEATGDSLAILTIIARKYSKLYARVHKWLDKERSYSHYYMDGTTSRTSSRDENHQNLDTGTQKGDIIPKAGKIRSVFIPDEDEGTMWDLSQVELRALAYLSDDPEMQAIMADPLRDMHIETQETLGLFSKVDAKAFNFSLIYLAEATTQAKALGIWDLDRIEQLRLAWRTRFSRAWEWMQSQQEEGMRTGYVETLYGRKLNIYDTNKDISEKHLRSCCVNWPIQGTAAEIFKRVMNALDVVIPVSALLAQIHDESWSNGRWEIPEEITHIAPFWTPIKVQHVRRFG